MIVKLRAPIVSNTPLTAPGHFVLHFFAPEIARTARPGQFVAVAEETGAQILRRPFSVFTADPASGEVSILFSVHGPTSRALAGRRAGDVIDVVGPLGRRVFEPDARLGVRHVCVGGGYGVPPLVFLARTLVAHDPTAEVIFIDGARTREFLVGTDGLHEIGVGLRPCTEDGSHGVCGRVTDVLEPLLADQDAPVCVYTCGPGPMMRAVAEMCIARNAPCQASLEVFMPCGLGICMGCAVLRPDGSYARGCWDGPVFDAREVVWQ